MLSENIKNLRKNKGLTQEELASKLNVVRQTVSKWEKGLSVPDAELLKKLAEILETDVSTLLGSSIMPDNENNKIAEQLSRINEQLVIKNRRAKRIWKLVGITLLTGLIIYIMLIVFGFAAYTFVDEAGYEEVTEIAMTESDITINQD